MFHEWKPRCQVHRQEKWLQATAEMSTKRSVIGKHSLRPNQAGKCLACMSMHTRDAGICNSCGPREETFGQCWQLEMKDRWSGAHLTECYTRVCGGGGWCSESHIIIIMQKSSTQALLDILWCLKKENMLEMFQPISIMGENWSWELFTAEGLHCLTGLEILIWHCIKQGFFKKNVQTCYTAD